MSLPYVGSGSLSGCGLRNLRSALGQQLVDGAQWHWQQSCNVAPVRQEKVHWLLPRCSVAEERGVLTAEFASSDWALVSAGAHTQSICSDVGLPAACLTCRGHLGLDAAEGVATLTSAGLGATV